MIIPIIALCVFFGTKTLRSIGRTAEVFIPFILISAVLLSILLVGDVPFSNLLPFFENGGKDFALGIDSFIVWFGDVSILLVCLGNVKISKRFALSSIIARAVSVVVVLVFSSIMFATYSNITDLIDYGHNVSGMTQYSLGNHDYGRFDYLIYCFWLFAVLIKLMLTFYTLTRNATEIFKAKNNLITSIILGVIIFVLTSFVLQNENIVYAFCTSPVKYFLAPIEFLLPVLVFVFARITYCKATEKIDQNSQPVSQNSPKTEIIDEKL